MTALLEMSGIAKRYGSNQALDGVTFRLEEGEVHALVGENGAGKSTLMRVLDGVVGPDRGSMTILGEPYAPQNPRDAARRGVAMIHQETMIAPHLSVEANVMLGQEESWLGIVRRASHRERVRQVLGLLEHAEIPLDLKAGRLTQAGRQIVEIARALIRESRILIFDEPTSSLNDQDATRLFGVIGGLRKRGIGIVYISHFLHELGRVAERFTVLRDGRSVATGRLAEVDPKGLASLMVGRELSELFPRVEHVVGGPLLTVSELRGVRLPVSASLTLYRGEILGIAGLVGSGRTEFLRAIYGLDEIRSGVIRTTAFGEFARTTPATSIKMGLGFLSEDRKGEGIALRCSIEDNLTDSALAKYGFAGWLNLAKRRRVARSWMDRLRIKARRPTALVGSLSGGNQQKVAIGRLLHQEAELLLLDEPTRGVDIGSKVEIYRMMGELAARGRSILMVSSQLPELLGVCDRIAVMSRGVLSPPRPVHEWTESKMMEAATAETPALCGY